MPFSVRFLRKRLAVPARPVYSGNGSGGSLPQAPFVQHSEVKIVKRTGFFLLICALLLSLAACKKAPAEPPTRTVEAGGQTLAVSLDKQDSSAGTVAANGETYSFRYTASGQQITLAIEYPDGYVYKRTELGGAAAESSSYRAEERERAGYLSAALLVSGLEQATRAGRDPDGSGASPALALLLLALGVWNLLAPKSVWWVCRGWWYKNAEPSDAALLVCRIGGVVLPFSRVLCLLAL